MPEAFDNCRAKGGKIRTKSLPGGKYIHICILNGKTYSGYVKEAKTKSRYDGRSSESKNKNQS